MASGDEVTMKSGFVGRIAKLPLVESGLQNMTNRYNSVKTRAPGPLKNAIDAAESAATLAKSGAEGMLQKFPSHVAFADDWACGMLDNVETNVSKMREMALKCPLSALSAEQLTSLTMTDEQKKFYLELFQNYKSGTGRQMVYKQINEEFFNLQTKLVDNFTQLYSQVQDVIKQLEENNSPQGTLAQLPLPVLNALRQIVRLMTHIVKTISEIKVKLSGEMQKMAERAQEYMALMRSEIHKVISDGSTGLPDFKAYLDRLSQVQPFIRFLKSLSMVRRFLGPASSDIPCKTNGVLTVAPGDNIEEAKKDVAPKEGAEKENAPTEQAVEAKETEKKNIAAVKENSPLRKYCGRQSLTAQQMNGSPLSKEEDPGLSDHYSSTDESEESDGDVTIGSESGGD